MDGMGEAGHPGPQRCLKDLVTEQKFNIYCKSGLLHPPLQLFSKLSGPNRFSQVSNV